MGNTLQIPIKFSQKKSSQLEEEDDNGTTFTCEICIEPILLPNKKFKNSTKCTHPFCTHCIIKYISVRIDDNISTITCPALNCDHSLDPLYCRQLIPRQLFDKWCDILCESALLEFDRCYCPNRDCSSVIVNECRRGSVKRSVCPNCKKLFCFQCKLPWHAGYRCEESGSGEMRDVNDVAFGDLAERQNWTRCPRCHHLVELVSGCSIVRCRCSTNFCYKCGKTVNLVHLCRQPNGPFVAWTWLFNLFVSCFLLMILLLFILLF